MNSLTSTSEVEAFMLHHGEKVVELIGGEIDRIEGILKVSCTTSTATRT